MKNINWDKCTIEGLITDMSDKKASIPPINPVIKPNIQVAAKYKGCNVYLRIIEQIETDRYKVKIIDIRKQSADKKPDDLKIEDEVSIDREFICHISLP